MINFKLAAAKLLVKGKAFFIKNGPRIMCVGGGLMAVGGSVMACKATLKAYDVVEEHKATMLTIEEARQTSEAAGDGKFTNEDYRQAKIETYLHTSVKMVRLYAPSLAVGLSGVGLMQGAFGIMDKRHSTTMAALTALDQAYSDLVSRTSGDSEGTNLLPEGIEVENKPETFALKAIDEDIDDADHVILQDYIPVEQFDILENDPWTIVFDNRNPNWHNGDTFVLNAGFIESTFNTFNLMRERYERPAIWVNDIRRAFSVNEAARGWSNGWSIDAGDSIYYDVIPCIYDKIDDMIVGMRPLYVSDEDHRFDYLESEDPNIMPFIDNRKRIALLKQLELEEIDNYAIVIRLYGNGKNGEPGYLRNKIYG